MWTIHEIDNTTQVPEGAVEKALEAATNTDCCWEYEDSLVEDGRLYFCPDNYEHMDYLSDEKFRKLLWEHGVRGRVTFGDLESGVRFWGYDFTDGGCELLEGTLEWSGLQ